MTSSGTTSLNNVIGSTVTGTGNVIAFNPIGVDVNSGTTNSIRGNAIFQNSQGIVLNTTNNANNSQARRR